ncbi:hypothetical protein QEG98_42000 (plasmid) [Myxococcus sp. MxC21-1]|uniref:hypothetical protein n=1 Tax=Myxococcus sp. MxC21-1 TaxID=3041439 RepID=UPI00292CB9A0|nr:hypothetical protein [Myxococcus sp. MxC21-1]WNZ66242.1 hypothetical protein QEG98_42000 [Myxococcus sp. MxC21-1]
MSIERRCHEIPLPDECPRCQRQLSGPEGIGVTVRGFVSCSTDADLETEPAALTGEGYTYYNHEFTYPTSVACQACGHCLYGGAVELDDSARCDADQGEAIASF